MIIVAAESAKLESSPVVKISQRLESIDLLRGLVMVVMALDHTRDFFSNLPYDPTNLSHTTPALFLTRWITHFCAPVFVFLAGTGAFLSGSKGKTKPQLARYLLTRGLWLVLLEVTIVKVGWDFNLDYNFVTLQVIWAIGWSMVALAGLIFLDVRAIALFGLIVILGHNLFDNVTPERLGAFGSLWKILHAGGMVALSPRFHIFALYPLIPWIGVMAIGYSFGALVKLKPESRRRWLIMLGCGLILAFIILRASRLYGDPTPWAVQPRGAIFTLFSFLNCEKYPASLMYLLMTLGPAILLLGLIPGKIKPVFKPLIVFGRTPLFYYILHLYLIHLLAVTLLVFRYGGKTFSPDYESILRADPGYPLPIIYLVWLSIVVALYPLCRWFAGIKNKRQDVWLSYF